VLLSVPPPLLPLPQLLPLLLPRLLPPLLLLSMASSMMTPTVLV
jgi:hypothetical protein